MFCVRYGEQAGKVSDDSLTTAGHVVDLASVSRRILLKLIFIIFIVDLLELENLGNKVTQHNNICTDILLLLSFFTSFLGKVGKVIASQDKEKEVEKEEKPVVPPRPVTDTVSTRDSISSTVSKSQTYTPPPVIKSHPQVKTKKEVLYA